MLLTVLDGLETELMLWESRVVVAVSESAKCLKIVQIVAQSVHCYVACRYDCEFNMCVVFLDSRSESSWLPVPCGGAPCQHGPACLLVLQRPRCSFA
jgi:hypothetical protein